MKEETRRAIAAAAAGRINGKAPSSVYSYERGQHSPMSPNYDYEAQAHISNSGSGLYHYGLQRHINFQVNGKNFSGYDNNEGHHFSGSVSGGSVQIYDYGEGRYFNYTV
jgi:hypothetical protein